MFGNHHRKIISVAALLGLAALGLLAGADEQSGQAAVSTDQLSTRVTSLLAADQELSPYAIRAIAEPAAIRLEGRVPSYSLYERAIEIAGAETAGVRLVTSDLLIQGPDLLRRLDDHEIVAQVTERLSAFGKVDAASLQVTSSNGSVTLTGRVSSPDARYQAGLLAYAAHSVRSVDNRLQVVG